MIELRGITWNHVRGYGPLRATAEAYRLRYPNIHIQWDVRTLQEFADYPIDKLTGIYDMVIIDHPFVGFGASVGCLLPLEERVDEALLIDQAENTVGASHQSYHYAGHQWALAIDAAAQVSAYRPDLLELLGAQVPRTWDDVLALAQTYPGRVAIPLIPVDSFCSFCSLCANAGEAPFRSKETVVSRSVGRYALETLRALKTWCHPKSLGWNPINLLDRMGSSEEIIYSPLLFGYSNYARPGFSHQLVHFADVPTTADSGPSGAILGGTGLAISSSSAHPAEACRYAAYVADAQIQRSVYFEGGGQPVHRSAWLDEQTNHACTNFFLDTLETLDRSYLRPRYNGFIKVQDDSASLIHTFLREDGHIDRLLANLDLVYRESLSAKEGTNYTNAGE